jgi:hypothetical protein
MDGMRMTFLLFSSAVSLAAFAAAAQDEDATPPDSFALERDETAAGAADGAAPGGAAELVELVPPQVATLPHDTEAAPAVIRNDDVVEMADAGFGATTIVAAIEANATAFDVTPRALLALKRAGVADLVIEAMLATKRQTAVESAALPAESTVPAIAASDAAGVAPATAEPPVETGSASGAAPNAGTETMSPEALAALSKMIEQLAAAPPSTEREVVRAEPQPENPNAPRAWVAEGEVNVPLAPSVAKVAYTDMKRPAATAFKTLQNFAGKALAFANPAIGVATSGLGSLFRNDDPEMTAVWALLGSSSPRALAAGAAFEVDFGNVPGVDPDRYQPAIVQLVPTSDNYRLVGAAKTEGSDDTAAPRGPIIEEPVAADLMRMARGRYRVALGGSVPPGEYALVLRPIVKRERARRRDPDHSLGELMGANATSQIIYLTWDFTIEG